MQNCSAQLHRLRYFPAALCRSSSLKVSMGDQHQGCFITAGCTWCSSGTGLRFSLLHARWQTAFLKYLLWPEWHLAHGKNRHLTFFFDHVWSMELRMKEMEKNKKQPLNTLKIILTGCISKPKLSASWGTSPQSNCHFKPPCFSEMKITEVFHITQITMQHGVNCLLLTCKQQAQ